MGHAFSFNIMLNGRETVILLQNTHYLAQLILEGIRMAINNYMNHVWLNNVLQPITPNVTPNVTQMMMGEWSLPPHFVPIQNLNLVITPILHSRDCNKHQPNMHTLGWTCKPYTDSQFSTCTTNGSSGSTTVTCTHKYTTPGENDGGGSGTHQLNTRIDNRRFKSQRDKRLSLHRDARTKENS